LVKAAVPLVMIVAEVTFLRGCRIEPEHHKRKLDLTTKRIGDSS